VVPMVPDKGDNLVKVILSTKIYLVFGHEVGVG